MNVFVRTHSGTVQSLRPNVKYSFAVGSASSYSRSTSMWFLFTVISQQSTFGRSTKFRSGDSNILVATDLASRGLDIPLVDLVINFDGPGHSKDSTHRVGRTARAGRAGKTIMMVTQYNVELLQRLECLLEKKLEE
ncbi:P-loop containing nucleoside triphosphate hydrolase protein [Armillaria mellea]|nr:P-loop containing nucleoside triphosphate hydrolase protein [Armillaria mellea]